jgi:hypothetical protein
MKTVNDDLKSQPTKFWKYTSSFRKDNFYSIQQHVNGAYFVELGHAAEVFHCPAIL